MPRPTEYENLVKTRAPDAVQPTPGAVAGFLKNAEGVLARSKSLLAGTPLATAPMQVFTNACKGYPQAVQAVLAPDEVRIKEAGRTMAIQRVSADLKLLNPALAIIRAQGRRNDPWYRSPLRPLSKADAATMVAILEKYLPVARAGTGLAA